MKFLRKFGCLALVSLMALVISGCTDQDWKDLASFAKTWAEMHNLADKDGNPNITKIFTRATGLSTDDEQADAAIDAGLTVKNFKDVEKLSEEARESGDIKTINKAIDLRPGEFRYYNQRGAINFFDNGPKAANDFRKADDIAVGYRKHDQLRNVSDRIKSLVKKGERRNIEKGPAEQLKRHYQMMSDTYHQRYLLSKQDADENASREYRKMRDQLPES